MITDPKTASNFFKKIGIETHQVKDAMIIGGDTTAFYLAKMLMQMGIDIKLIEQKRTVVKNWQKSFQRRRSYREKERIRGF